MGRVSEGARRARDAAPWWPSNMRLLFANRPWHDRSRDDIDEEIRLRAAAGWLCRAQDATTDGGISWGYRMRSGWAPSYPETTGYIVPTFLTLAAATGDASFVTRAERCIGFLEGVQQGDGSFPAGTTASPREPSVFNTAQIIAGLAAWIRATGDERVVRMARSAADWLVAMQDDDGAWRRHGYSAYPVTYTAHASCWLAELGVDLRERRYTEAAARHLDWVMRQQDSTTGWFERSGFTAADHQSHRAVTHTLAYTLWGVIHTGALLDRADAIAAALRPARSLAELVVTTGELPGVVDASWQGRAGYACLTGNAQMALIWMRLTELDPDPRFAAAAGQVLQSVGAAQLVTASNPGVAGGIPGSDPIWGDYIRFALPNWSAKFYVDCLLARRPDAPAEA